MGDDETVDRPYKSARDILAAPDFEENAVWIEPWQTMVRVRSMTVGQRTKFDMLVQQKGMSVTTFKTKVVVMCCVDENGAPMFKKEDEAALSKCNAVAINELFAACMKASRIKLTSDGADAVEEAEQD